MLIMKIFAKIYESTEIGQILIKLDSHGETGLPEVRLYFTSPGVGVCSVALGFKEGQEDKAEKAFKSITLNNAIKIVSDIYEKINLLRRDNENISSQTDERIFFGRSWRWEDKKS